MKLRIWTAGLVLGLAALAADSGQDVYQKAHSLEQAGKLDEAIKLYEKVAHDFASDRALAAKALVAAAKNYEKQGQDNAVKLYQRVASEYGDQREFAAAANRRLTALRLSPPPPTMTQRKIEVLPGTNGTSLMEYSTDGRREVYFDAAANALVISDLDGRNKHVIYKAKPGETFRSFASRDLSMVYVRLDGAEGKVTRFVIKSDGTGYRELPGAPDLAYPDWSWDNRYLVYAGVGPGPTMLGRTIGGGIVVVSVADGKAREVVRRDPGVDRARLSPDGRFIALAELGDGADKIFVVPVEGGEPRLVSEGAGAFDWTADGRFLAITSQRSGASALYLYPVKDGQRSGEPVLVRNGSIRDVTSLPNGSLVFSSIRTGSQAALSASLDSKGRFGAWKSLDLNIAGNAVIGTMQWSPDGSQLSYASGHQDAGQRSSATRIRNMVTGQDREVYQSATISLCMWDARLPNLLCLDLNGSTGELSSVALDSNRVDRLGSITFAGPFDYDALERLARGKGFEPVLPDGMAGILGPNWPVRVVNRNLEFRLTKESDWKRLATLNSQPDLLSFPAHSSYGVFFFDKDSAGKDGLFRIPLEGGQPERLGDAPPGNLRSRFIHVSPDGRNILVEGIANDGTDTWLLENFTPKAPAAR